VAEPAPAFTLIVLCTLALRHRCEHGHLQRRPCGVLEPLPFQAAGRLVRVWHENTSTDIREGAAVPLSVFGPDDIGRSRGSRFLSVVARAPRRCDKSADYSAC